jgi:hypothetical protein
VVGSLNWKRFLPTGGHSNPILYEYKGVASHCRHKRELPYHKSVTFYVLAALKQDSQKYRCKGKQQISGYAARTKLKRVDVIQLPLPDIDENQQQAALLS